MKVRNWLRAVPVRPPRLRPQRYPTG